MAIGTTANPQAARVAAPQAAWVRRHPLASYFLLTFALGWAGLLPAVADARGLLPFPVPALLVLPLVGGSPGLAAMLVAIASGHGRDLRARLTRVRFAPDWWAAALLGSGALLGLAAALHGLLGGAPLHPAGPEALPPAGIGLALALALLAGGAEVGWRGFALPRLLHRHDPLEASLLLGLVSTTWHLPYFFWIGHPLASTPVPAFVLFALAGSVVLTWLTRGAGGSALPAMLFQAVSAAGQALVLSGAGDTRPFELSAGLSALIAALLVLTGRLRPTDASAEHV